MERSDVIFRPARKRGLGHRSFVKGLPKKPHASPPAGILSVWQIKENPVGNDLLIIVNGLDEPTPILPTVAQPPLC